MGLSSVKRFLAFTIGNGDYSSKHPTELYIFINFLCVYSESEPKGSECYDQFTTMQQCFARYPTVYNKSGDNDDEDFPNLDISDHIESENNVDTVDQLEESEKSSTKSSTESTISKKQ